MLLSKIKLEVIEICNEFRSGKKSRKELICSDGTKIIIGKKLGRGGYGQLYAGVNIDTKTFVAVKRELANANNMLPREYANYKSLKAISRRLYGFPIIYDFCAWDHRCNAMVMEMLGPSLQDIFERRNRPFSLKTVLLIAQQALHRIEFVHKHGLVHLDIKPANFLIGSNFTCRHMELFLVDFGLARTYRTRDGDHIRFRTNIGFTGTPEFTSLNGHLGNEMSRRDDLESLGYMLIYLFKGRLPWHCIEASNYSSHTYNAVGDMKSRKNFNQLLLGMPYEFVQYMKYVRNLEFDAQPNYGFMRGILKSLYICKHYQHDSKFDWPPHFITSILKYFCVYKSTPPLIDLEETITNNMECEDTEREQNSSTNSGYALRTYSNLLHTNDSIATSKTDSSLSSHENSGSNSCMKVRHVVRSNQTASDVIKTSGKKIKVLGHFLSCAVT